MKYVGYDNITKSFTFEAEDKRIIRKSVNELIQFHPEVCESIVKSLQDALEKSIEEDITEAENINDELIEESIQKSLDSYDIMKGKRATVGEIREWSGKKYQKTVNGWVPVKEDKKKEDSYQVFADKVQEIDNDKFRNGYGFISKIGDKNVAFLSYNSGGQKDLNSSSSLNLSSLKKLDDKYHIDPSIVLNLQAHYDDKAEKVTKLQFKDKNIDMVIITDHNVDNVRVINNKKTT